MIGLISNKIEYRYYLRADMESHGIQSWQWLIHRYRFPTLHFQRLLRKVEYYKNCRKDWIGRILYLFWMYRFRETSIRLGFSIPANVFGPGLSIAHFGSIVVNGNTRVGKNCRLHSATNIGEAYGKSPIVGDNVYIGPGAKLFGGIAVGDNVAIGANAVVNKDVPSNVTVAGVPAKVISHQGSGSLLIKGADRIPLNALVNGKL